RGSAFGHSPRSSRRKLVTASVEQRDIRECHPSRAALRFQRNGRFAVDYRKVFGESPSEMLRAVLPLSSVASGANPAHDRNSTFPLDCANSKGRPDLATEGS